MHRTAVTLSAATIVAALWVGGCASAPPPQQAPEPSSTAAPTPVGAPLPPPEALTGVLYQLADPSIPAERKVALVQHATPQDQQGIAGFSTALRDGGYGAVTIEATDVAWVGAPSGNVRATVTIASTDDPGKRFAYPMEFNPVPDGWQLTRSTADQVLALEPAPR